MVDGVWKGGHSKQLSLNKFFDPSTPSMRKGRDGGKKKRKKKGKKKKKKKIRMKIVATTSLPAVDRPNADRWNAARSRQCSDFHTVRNMCAKSYALFRHFVKKLKFLSITYDE